MENQVQIFKNEEFGEIRGLNINGEPWFVGKDIAEKLGYSDVSATVSKKVDSEDKIKEMIAHCQNGKVVKTQTTIINESGLYSLVLSSKLESAKKFKHWVTSDVLPSIRKHGTYMTPEVIEQTLTNPDFIIKLATQLKEEQTKRKIAEEKNVILDSENKTLTADMLSWADDSIVNALIRKYGASLKEGKMGFSKAWIAFKKELLYKYSININSRLTHYLNETGNKTKPKTLSVIRNKEEMTQCVKTAIALCKDKEIDVQDIIGKYIA